MKTYDDISVIYDATSTSYDGANLMSYIFTEISHKTESIRKYLARTLTENISKTDILSRVVNYFRSFIENRFHTEILSRVVNYFRSFIEKLTKIDSVSKHNVFNRVFTEITLKTEVIRKSLTRKLSEVRTHTEIFSRSLNFTRTFVEKITKLDTWKGLINQTVIFFNRLGVTSSWTNRAKPIDSSFTNKDKPSDSIFINRTK